MRPPFPRLRRAPRRLPLPFPRLDGSTWPDPGGLSFAGATLVASARQEAFSPAAHDVADVVLEDFLPLLDDGAEAGDAPYGRQVCSSAAQLGAAVGLVEQRALGTPEGETDRDAAAALWAVAGDLPRMPPRQQDVARFLLQCGYLLARTDPGLWRERLWEVTGVLWQEPHPAVRPAPSGDHRPGDPPPETR